MQWFCRRRTAGGYRGPKRFRQRLTCAMCITQTELACCKEPMCSQQAGRHVIPKAAPRQPVEVRAVRGADIRRRAARTQLGFLASLSRPVVPPPPSPPAVCGRAGSAGSAVRLRLSWPGYAAVPMQNPRFPGGWMAIGSFSADGRSGARALTGGSAESFIRAKGIPLHLAGQGHDMDHDRGPCWTDRHARQACLMSRGRAGCR